MAVPASKPELLAAISTQFDKLMQDLQKVSADHARKASVRGHVADTLISPADLVAHLLGWNLLVLKWLDRDDRGEAVDFPETGFQWNQLGALAQKFYADHQSVEWDDLLQNLSAAQARLIQTVRLRSEDELYGRPWYGKWTKGRMIQLNSASPYANARGRIRKWLRAGGVA